MPVGLSLALIVALAAPAAAPKKAEKPKEPAGKRVVVSGLKAAGVTCIFPNVIDEANLDNSTSIHTYAKEKYVS